MEAAAEGRDRILPPVIDRMKQEAASTEQIKARRGGKLQ
jgi:hypothetical protein